jgi:hypothetical protein
MGAKASFPFSFQLLDLSFSDENGALWAGDENFLFA